ncbi:MAG TPA: c-type cytochrome [Xanthobacteraceae bacterium]
MRSTHAIIASALLGVSALMPARAIDVQDFDQIQRGKYLVAVGDCGGCHTLPGSGELLAGGRPIETPFGTLLGPNITPDRETGIGAWTDDEFINSLTKGTGRNGAHIYPAMPYTYMTKTTREDGLAIRAYLNTIPAVHNPVQPNQLRFPFDVRTGLFAWDELHFRPGEFQPVAGKSAAWNRGAYLVEGLAHCGLCHTPKTAAGADEISRRFTGYALEGWFAPDITNDMRHGIGSWSTDDVMTYLKTGHNRFAAANGPMALVITDSTSKLSYDDLDAIATYLKNQPVENAANVAEQAGAPDAGVMKSGGTIYADQCAACHASDGSGVDGLFPMLQGSAVVQSLDPASVLHVILRGARSVATDPAPTAPAMPSFAWTLTDDQVAAVATYIRNAWGNHAPPVETATVGQTRRTLEERAD